MGSAQFAVKPILTKGSIMNLPEVETDLVLHSQSKLIIDYLRPLLLEKASSDDGEADEWHWLQGIDLHRAELERRINDLNGKTNEPKRTTSSTVS